MCGVDNRTLLISSRYLTCFALPTLNALQIDWSSSEYIPSPDITLPSKSSKSQYILRPRERDGISSETFRVCFLKGSRTYASWVNARISLSVGKRHLI